MTARNTNPATELILESLPTRHAGDARPAPAEPFTIHDEKSANWLLRKLATIESEKQRVQTNAATILAQLNSDADGLKYLYGAQIEAYCRSRLQETGDRRKSIQFLQGKCSFRTIPGALRITDSAAALAYAQECLPAAMTTVPTLDTAAYQQRAERTGELLPGLEFTPEHTSFALTFGKQTGD